MMDGRTHVMHLLPSLNVGGMENGVVNVTNRIDQRRFKISICCINELGPMAARIAEGAASVTCLGQGPGKSARLFKTLYGLLRTRSVDILHTHNYYTSVYGVPAARAARVNVVYGQHGFGHDPRTNKILKRNVEIVLCRLSTHVCCVARQLEDIVCSDLGIARRKVSTILNGVDCGRFASGPERRTRLRAELGIRDGEVLIGSVGRLQYEKNYSLLVESVAELAKGLPVRLLLVGDGPEAQALRTLAEALGCEKTVMMQGERRDIPELMSAMDVFALSSRSEGLPNTVLEAMCAGLPVVATTVGGIPDVVADGTSGFLVASGDRAALGSRLGQLLNDAALRRAMGIAGRSIATTRFSLDRMVAEYEAMYRSVYGGAPQ